MVRVIVVDDEKDAVDTMEAMLKIENVEVVGKGYNGEQAYQLYKEHEPDFVLLDMKMPEFDGAYAIEKIKTCFPNAKIIVLTGYTDYEFTSGLTYSVFYKPYDFSTLLETIKPEIVLETNR